MNEKYEIIEGYEIIRNEKETKSKEIEKIFLLFLGLYSRIKIQKRLTEIMLQKGHNENKNK